MRISSLKARVRGVEQAHGAGNVTLFFADGTTRGFNLGRESRLQVLLAAFQIARFAHNPDAKPDADPRALQLAQLVATATRIVPPCRLWETIAAIVGGSRKES